MNSSRSKSVWLFLLLTWSASIIAQSNTEICDQYIDLVFAIDASGSVQEDGYRKIKEFTKEIIKNFDVGPSKTHVGVVTFSETAQLQIKLTETFDQTELLKKVDGLDYPGYRTALDDALRVVNSAMFSLDGGARQGVPQVLIFLTDGKCTVCTEDLRTVVKPLKDAGVTIYTVGVTDNTNRTELEIISSDPSSKYMFEVDDFDQLKSIILKLNQKTCVVKKGKCAKPLPPFKCAPTREENECDGDQACDGNKKCCSNGCVNKCQFPLANCLSSIDIAFALDSSRSVRADTFQQMKLFANDIVDSFEVSQRDARFASLMFSSEAEVNFNFIRYDTATQVKQAISSLPHKRSDTNINVALEKVKSDIFSLQGKVRTRRPMVLIVFYDGDVTSGTKDLAEVVAPLKAYGVKVVAIGVGPEVNEYQLNKIAQSSNTVFKATSFDGLLPELYSIASESCSEKPGQCPVEETPVDSETCVGVVDKCDNDFDCYGNAKCCKQGCANKCYLPAEKCKRKVDIAFAVHQNIAPNDFDLIKYFVKSSVDHFVVGTDESHVALMSFGHNAKVVFDFNEDQKWEGNLKFQMDTKFEFVPGKGKIVDVLKLACDNIFCAAGGTRNNVPKMLVIVTGPFDRSDPTELKSRVQTLRSRGVDVVVIGVGNADVRSLQEVTSNDLKVDNQVLLAKNFNGILQYVQDIADFACGEAGNILPPPSGSITEGQTCGAAKIKGCLKGHKGSRGRPGAYAGRGEAGPRGPVGQKGIAGVKGPVGDEGLMGLTGDRGYKGLIGLPGFPGYDGIPGVPGVQGREGLCGDCGKPGKAGEAGLAGLDGFAGVSGRKGPAGIKGKKGQPTPFDANLEIAPGDDGDPGEKGDVGFKGEKGKLGFFGMKGDDGVDGDTGPKGFMGNMGEEGVVTMEKGMPGDEGDRGDAGPPGAASATGGDIGSIKGGALQGPNGTFGSKGETGDVGKQGINSEVKGIQGPAGPPGINGDSGETGPPGPTGSRGAIGKDGFRGDKGGLGMEGQAGIDGGKGPTGEEGLKGETGPQGRRGNTGEPFPGESGKKGKSGLDGWPGQGASIGPPGPPGPQGERGMSTMGPTGDDGGIGPRGDRGSDGTPGEEGMPGLGGAKGQRGDQGSKGDTGRNAEPIPGEPGMNGPPGKRGVPGGVGNQGAPGTRGPPETIDTTCVENQCSKYKGQAGPSGLTGVVGMSGPKGVNGSKGYMGGPCPVCPSGDSGLSGDTGKPGKVGDVGSKGNTGERGSAGEKGVRGEPGITGSRGNKGSRGESGERGNIGPKGPDALGLPGILTQDGEVGQPGSNGAAGKRGEEGRTGDDGPKGNPGSQGKRGVEGGKGMAGSSGKKGGPGANGKRGDRGDPGEDARGLPGSLGDKGREGPQGKTGQSGFKGRKGQPGDEPTEEQKQQMKNKMAGDKGAKGPTGDIGAFGKPGPKGRDSGRRGKKGDHGKPGPIGFGGMEGDNGFKGKAGEDGDPGPAGFPGRNGARGESGTPGSPGKEGKAPKGIKGKAGERGLNGKRGVDAPPPVGCINIADSADVAFIMDSSKSVNEADFNRQREFILKILDQFQIGPRQTQAGVIKYGRTANVEISFDDFFTQEALRESISDIQHDLARESRLDLALKLARDELFTQRRGARSDNPQVEQALVILGDGFISGGGFRTRELMENARQYATDLKQSGVLVFTLAVGAEKNKFLLQDFATKESYYLEVSSYTELVQRIGLLKDNLASSCTVEGEPGKDGFEGFSGDKGEPGKKGESGMGPKGFPGFNGPEGLKGAPGDVNLAVGEDGDPGKKGEKGDNGFSGFRGMAGEGKRGKKGVKGIRANPVDGVKGAPGDGGPQGPPGPVGQRLCDNVLATDILFILDTSSGVGLDNFNKMKQFVINIVKPFDIDNLLTRVGVITFHRDAFLEVRLSDHSTEKSLFESIDRIQYGNGPATRIDKALLLAASDGFAERNGARNGVNKALVLMTDGQQSYARDQVEVEDAIKPLADSNVLRYAIGIGREISAVELEVIADKNVVLADNFDALLTKIDDQIGLIGRGGCKGDAGFPGKQGGKGDDGFDGNQGPDGESGKAGSEGPKGDKGSKGSEGEVFGVGGKGDRGDIGDEGPTGLPGCNEKESRPVPTDLGFVIDASASLYDYGFKDELKFVTDIMEKVGPMSSGGLRAGVVVYSASANTRIYMNDHFSTGAFNFAVNGINYDNAGQTRIDLGFEEAKKLFDPKNGARASSKKVLILMTDGQQTYVPDSKEPSEIAKELSQEGVDIFSVGIGEEIDRVELESFITKPEHIFLASDLEGLLDHLVKEITQALICEGGPRGNEGRAGNDGPPGDAGTIGSIGDAGPKGDQGDAGFGPQGEKGVKGYGGFPGTQGEKGFRGPDGQEGPRGPIGSLGSVGPQGPKGDEGFMGFLGDPGTEGPDGLKGQKGETDGDGRPGAKGVFGEQGRKGETGDIGSLPAGNELKDLQGERGEQGKGGNKGGEGAKGRMLVAPGPIGLGGEKGTKGDAGEFGPRGEIGFQGFRGQTGAKGSEGSDGDDGDVGFPGLTGRRGPQGDQGEPGSGRKGEHGSIGSIGELGDIGDVGEPGFFGFIGMHGQKGGRGEQGPKGRQQIPVDGEDEEMQGSPGEKGYEGSYGQTGEPGEPGTFIEQQGGPGGKGEKGSQGPRGDQGSAGPPGIDGMVGLDGPKGRVGSGGDPGAQGRNGPRGEMGMVIGGSELGDEGDVGPIGLTGRPGLKGVKGITGIEGDTGAKGSRGPQGGNGFPGLVGNQGPKGGSGSKGPEGSQGVTGLEGLGGPAGPTGNAKNFGYYITRHSQNSYIPNCPRDYKVMWEGYSLMYTVGNGHAHSQDLGEAGSCSKSFSTLPFLFCGITGTCQYASRNDFTYWLSGDVQQPMMPVNNDAIEPFISRCVVCEAPDISMAVHSQDVVLPSCPTGYESLWSGYSFLMVAAAGKTGAGQSLASPGSCLEEFRPKPFIECQGARGTCHFFSDKFSFWLVTIDPSRQFQEPTPTTLSKTKGDDLTSRVSRCRVCLRSSNTGGDVNVPEAGNGLRRFARGVKKWLGY